MSIHSLTRLFHNGLIKIQRLASWILDVLYPQDCVFCRAPSGGAGYICQPCLEKLSFHRNTACTICGAESAQPEAEAFICWDCMTHRPAFERVFIVARYEGAIRDLIHLFKYQRGVWLLQDLARFMAAVYWVRIQPLNLPIDLIVPVPMERRKLKTRGYNQAALLAQALRRAIGIPYQSKWLIRVKTDVSSQTHLHRSARLANAEAAYRPTYKQGLTGKTILLVDDVMTTGATCNACAKHLRDSGAKAVYVLALARPIRL